MDKKKCCVVVPIYKSGLAEIEWGALRNNRKILREYDFIAVSPTGLNLKLITDVVNFESIQYFDKAFFQSPQTYSRLLVNESFWKNFAHYDYMLIAQLDTYIFSDKLEHFCNKGLDYVGAPWLNGFGANNILSIENIKSFFNCSVDDSVLLHDFFNKHGIINEKSLLQRDYWKKGVEQLVWPVSWLTPVNLSVLLDEIVSYFQTYIGVGNGGLSLRNIKKCLQLYSNPHLPVVCSVKSHAIEQFSAMKNDLGVLQKLVDNLHEKNRQIIKSMEKIECESDYSMMIISIIGEYTPERFGTINSLSKACGNLVSDRPELQPIVGVLGNLENDVMSIYLPEMLIPEDFFWSQIAPLFLEEYKVASIDEALEFAFECNPEFCYQRNHRKLPLGCHAWQLHQNIDFWERFIGKSDDERISGF